METVSDFKQTAKVGTAGNFINQMMANNNSIPEVGKGATELLYSDRHCYEVIEVSEDKKTVKLEVLNAKADKSQGPLEIGHQNWILEPTGQFFEVVWFRGKWRTVGKEVLFTEDFVKNCGHHFPGKALTPEQTKAVYGDAFLPQNEVEGITKAHKRYNPIKLLFGVKDYRYDWEF